MEYRFVRPVGFADMFLRMMAVSYPDKNVLNTIGGITFTGNLITENDS